MPCPPGVYGYQPCPYQGYWVLVSLPKKITYATLPESTPSIPNRIYTLFNTYMRPSQNLPLSPRIYLPFQQLDATLSESTPPSQNIPPSFSRTICGTPRIYPSLPEYTPFFNNYKIMRPSKNLSLPPRIYPPFQQL